MHASTLTCSSCNQSFELTPEYLAQYAGQTTTCQCGAPLQIPTERKAVTQLSYAAPAIPSKKIPANAWRDGQFLFIARGVRLPNRCAHCGMPVDKRFRLATLVDIKPGALSAQSYLMRHFLSDRVRIRYGYCREHMPWIMSSAARITCIACAVAIPLILAVNEQLIRNPQFLWPTVALVLVAGVYIISYFFLDRPIKIQSMDYKHVLLKGFKEEHLQYFPPIEEKREQDSKAAVDRLDAIDESFQ